MRLQMNGKPRLVRTCFVRKLPCWGSLAWRNDNRVLNLTHLPSLSSVVGIHPLSIIPLHKDCKWTGQAAYIQALEADVQLLRTENEGLKTKIEQKYKLIEELKEKLKAKEKKSASIDNPLNGNLQSPNVSSNRKIKDEHKQHLGCLSKGDLSQSSQNHGQGEDFTEKCNPSKELLNWKAHPSKSQKCSKTAKRCHSQRNSREGADQSMRVGRRKRAVTESQKQEAVKEDSLKH